MFSESQAERDGNYQFSFSMLITVPIIEDHYWTNISYPKLFLIVYVSTL